MKHITLCMLLLCAAAYSRACTVCGCSASNQYLGILPQYNKHFIGLQYQFRNFESHHVPGEADETNSVSNEYYNTVQLWGRFNVGKHLQLFAFLPYVSNLKKEDGVATTISGLGDATVLVNYRILGSKESSSDWKQNLQAGGGVKLPTGAYDVNSIQYTEGLPNMQPGTNSWDFIANANYTLRHKQTGINIDASYTMTTPNSIQYKYGNRFSAGALGFYWLQKKSWSILPQAGLRFDVAGTDYDNYSYRWENDMSGGEQLYASAGVQAYYKRVGVQLMGHLPLMQHYASGLVKAGFKTEAGVYFLF
ncbi:MAG TPA: hypothetical protein VL093_06800 [Flavipsychrobacter sp.]|nr:hypothetical protein [Flavipsychrobacter sp.]